MKYLHKNKYWEINKDYNVDKLLYLMIDRPNIIVTNYITWENNKNEYHRDYDLPSLIYKSDNSWHSNSLCWCVNNKFQRKHHDNNPSLIFNDGYKEYWMNDKLIRKENEI